jgi:hypothetical protein
MSKVKLPCGFEFNLKHKNFNESKPLNLDLASSCLKEVNKILSPNLRFGLIFGTLLGAVREHGFIQHDTDIDLFVLDEDKNTFLNLIPALLANGFEVCRYEKELVSIIKNDIYIDFYFFRKKILRKRFCNVGLEITPKYIEDTQLIDFYGEKFWVPKDCDGALTELYGKDWRVPQKNAPVMQFNKYIIIREKIKKNMPLVFKFISYIKNIFK